MTLMKWKPKNQDPFFGDLLDWDNPSFGLSLFPTLRRTGGLSEGYLPALDIAEEKDRIIVKADLPGLKKEEIDIAVDGSILTIRGERRSEKEDKEKNYHRVERVYGSFQRSVDLGTNVVAEEKIKASYKDGVLEVVLPKAEARNTKRITVE
jgi:HSP20 family protein